MKRFFKWLGVSVAALSLFLVVACSNVNQKYADKVNQAAKDGAPITLEQVRKDLGDNRVEVLVLNSGVVISVKDCKTSDELKEKLDKGEDVEGLIVTILASKATGAEYRKITSEDLKK